MPWIVWLPFVLNTVCWGLYFAVTKGVVEHLHPLLFAFLEVTATVPVAGLLVLRYGCHLT